MAKKNFYAVKKGKTPGIYRTWEECKKQVAGFSGAIYKGFSTEAEAAAFMGENPVGGPATETEDTPCPKEGEGIAYVDGSYNTETGYYACGIVFFCENGEEHYNEKGMDIELAGMRNVAGELLGARRAMEMAIKRGLKKLIIYHDYQGIASWCLGEWKTNKEGTRAYKEYYDSIQGKLDVAFCKVKGHSGDTWNDLADQLAKELIF